MAVDNRSLGRFILDGIPPAPRGLPQVEVTLDVDANGILSVKAMDKTSGKTQSIRIEASSGLSDEDIKRMREDADKHAGEDAVKKEMAELKNNAEMLMYSAEKSLKDAGDKVTQEIKSAVESAIGEVRKLKDGTDKDALKRATDTLSTEMQKIGEHMAKNSSGGQTENKKGEQPESDTNASGGSSKEGDEPKDVDFKENPGN